MQLTNCVPPGKLMSYTKQKERYSVVGERVEDKRENYICFTGTITNNNKEKVHLVWALCRMPVSWEWGVSDFFLLLWLERFRTMQMSSVFGLFRAAFFLLRVFLLLLFTPPGSDSGVSGSVLLLSVAFHA